MDNNIDSQISAVWPKLAGTPKQIKFAEDIRGQALVILSNEMAKHVFGWESDSPAYAEIRKAVIERYNKVCAMTDAKSWINRRYELNHIACVQTWIRAEMMQYAENQKLVVSIH